MTWISYTFINLSPFVKYIWPSFIPNEHYDIQFSLKNIGTQKKEILGIKQPFDRESIVCFLISLAIGVWYFMKKVTFFFSYLKKFYQLNNKNN